jgi:hypothetical protein
MLKTPQNSHMGLMETQIGKELSFLHRRYSVHFDAFILSGSRGPTAIDEGKMVNVVLYGLHETLDAIGWHLSERRLYLQHPRAYDTSVTYNNPHYFLPPGEKLELPDLISLDIEDNEKKSRSRLLNDCLEVFETADIPDSHEFSGIEVIRGLTTPLKALGTLSVQDVLNGALTHLVTKRWPSHSWRRRKRAVSREIVLAPYGKSFLRGNNSKYVSLHSKTLFPDCAQTLPVPQHRHWSYPERSTTGVPWWLAG